MAALCIGVFSLGFASCDDGLEVRQVYPFTVETMPIPKRLAKGETAEIRCELKREGDFSGTMYTIRYFQFDGKGELKLDNGLVLQPNDRYLLENDKFRLYYTSKCDESQSLSIVVEDNWGTACEWKLDFNHDSDMDTEKTMNVEKGGVISKG